MKSRRVTLLALCASAVCVLLYFFPLLHVRKLDAPSVTPLSGANSTAFDIALPEGASHRDIARFVETLWTEQLPKAAENVATVEEVLAMAATDPEGARKKFGREVGIGGPTFLFLQGRGRIESVDDDACLLVIDGLSQRLTLAIGILLGNAVRDGSGLANVDDFPNSQEYNQLSKELNERCEAEVIGPIRSQLVVGAHIDFSGCAELHTNDDFMSLELVPVRIKIIKPVESTE